MAEPSEALAAVEAVQRIAELPSLNAVAAELDLQGLRLALADALGAAQANEDPEAISEAIFTLALQSFMLALHSMDDEEDSADALGLPAAVVELAANSLAAFVTAGCARGEGGFRRLQVLGSQLDVLSPLIFGGLCRTSSIKSREARRRCLALRGLCVWSLAALGCAVSLEDFSGLELWEWSSNDATWAMTLVKGVLETSQEDLGALQLGFADADSSSVALPENLPLIKRAAASAALGIASSDVAFSQATGDDLEGVAITMAMRAAELVLHRADAAIALLNAGLLPVLLNFVDGDLGLIIRLAGFLSSVSQTELQGEVGWASMEQSELMQAMLKEARRASAIFASHVESDAPVIWKMLASVFLGLPGTWPAPTPSLSLPSFLHECAELAFSCSPSEKAFDHFATSCLGVLGRGCLLDDMSAALAPLCVLAARSNVAPNAAPDSEAGSSAALELTSALTSSSTEIREAILHKWDHWRGAPLPPAMEPWRSLVRDGCLHEAVSQEAPPEEPARPAPPDVPPPPPPARAAGGALSHLLREAPNEYRCAIDLQLMMDPVRSPAGFLFDRATLAKALQSSGGLCPKTRQPLTLEDCPRVPELRKQIQVWVRRVQQERLAQQQQQQ